MNPSPLKSLAEHNRERESVDARSDAAGTGIACPTCGAELLDVPGWVLLSRPQRVRVDCPMCEWSGYRNL